MIFVTVGGEKYPFDRLLKAIDRAVVSGRIADRVFAQTGSCLYRPAGFPFRRNLKFPEMVRAIQSADIVVSHAGVGSILLCLDQKKVPILLARQARFGEHVDDHQMEFMEKAVCLGHFIWARDENDLIDRILAYGGAPEIPASGPGGGDKAALIAFLRMTIDRS